MKVPGRQVVIWLDAVSCNFMSCPNNTVLRSRQSKDSIHIIKCVLNLNFKPT